MIETAQNRRSYRRRLTPYLCVEFNGQVFQVKDWSLSGFAIYELDRIGTRLQVGHEIEGTFSRPDEGAPSFPFCAAVADVRERENVAAFEFTELFAASYTALETLVVAAQAEQPSEPQEAAAVAV